MGHPEDEGKVGLIVVVRESDFVVFALSALPMRSKPAYGIDLETYD